MCLWCTRWQLRALFAQAWQPAAPQQRYGRVVPRATVDDLEIQELVLKLDEMVSGYCWFELLSLYARYAKHLGLLLWVLAVLNTFFCLQTDLLISAYPQ